MLSVGNIPRPVFEANCVFTLVLRHSTLANFTKRFIVEILSQNTVY
uniref:Uncharacterized protein n=1 Tax=Anguilla anguilla TaxID=7936 RepID=A0A0E9RI44_ANGAN